MRTVASIGLALLAAGPLGACGRSGTASPDTPGTVSVVTAFYPLQFVAERVGGGLVSVSNLTAPGAEPHDLELKPQQARQIADADVVVYLGGFQPEVDETVRQQAGDRSLDVGTAQPLFDAPEGAEEEASGKDLHVWLDPTRLAAIADVVADRLAKVDGAGAADVKARAGALRRELDTLDREYAAGLKTCQRHEIVTSHAAFGYLARRYGLRQVPITGLSPEEEPTPQHLADVAQQARALGVTTIFFEALVSPRVAQTLANEVGARAEVLDPIEGLAPGSSGDYLSVMRDNLGRLRTALGCG
jgi:zinc transport system substrate-binding protein